METMCALPREEVVKAVERRSPAGIPLVMTHWWGEGLVEQYGDRLAEFDRYPVDAPVLFAPALDPDVMDLPWRDPEARRSHDAGGAIPDWSVLDEFIARLPDPDRPGALDHLHAEAEAVRGSGRYLLWGFWRLFFEMPWGLRGMENLLVDYYVHPDKVHRLHDALCSLYERWIRRAVLELRPDGFWTSDDLGNQKQSMMRPPQFRELLKPYYQRISRVCRENGIHFWLHSCGNNGPLLDDLIDAGVEVFHPVQKHTMDERETAARFGGRITLLAGLDVQHILQEASPDDVRREVRHLIDTLDRPDGGMCLASGNGIVAGTPFENIEAFLDEGYRYGRSRHKTRSLR